MTEPRRRLSFEIVESEEDKFMREFVIPFKTSLDYNEEISPEMKEFEDDEGNKEGVVGTGLYSIVENRIKELKDLANRLFSPTNDDAKEINDKENLKQEQKQQRSFNIDEQSIEYKAIYRVMKNQKDDIQDYVELTKALVYDVARLRKHLEKTIKTEFKEDPILGEIKSFCDKYNPNIAGCFVEPLALVMKEFNFPFPAFKKIIAKRQVSILTETEITKIVSKIKSLRTSILGWRELKAKTTLYHEAEYKKARTIILDAEDKIQAIINEKLKKLRPTIDALKVFEIIEKQFLLQMPNAHTSLLFSPSPYGETLQVLNQNLELLINRANAVIPLSGESTPPTKMINLFFTMRFNQETSRSLSLQDIMKEKLGEKKAAEVEAIIRKNVESCGQALEHKTTATA